MVLEKVSFARLSKLKFSLHWHSQTQLADGRALYLPCSKFRNKLSTIEQIFALDLWANGVFVRTPLEQRFPRTDPAFNICSGLSHYPMLCCLRNEIFWAQFSPLFHSWADFAPDMQKLSSEKLCAAKGKWTLNWDAGFKTKLLFEISYIYKYWQNLVAFLSVSSVNILYFGSPTIEAKI